MRRGLDIKSEHLLRQPLQTRDLSLGERPELRTALGVAREWLGVREQKGLKMVCAEVRPSFCLAARLQRRTEKSFLMACPMRILPETRSATCLMTVSNVGAAEGGDA